MSISCNAPNSVLNSIRTSFQEGRWSDGFVAQDHLLPKLNRNTPQWHGEECDYLLLHLSGGLGDVVMFSRFFPILQERGIHLVLNYCDNPEAKAQLIELMRRQNWCGSDLLTDGLFDDFIELTEGAEPKKFWQDLPGLLDIFAVTPETVCDYPPPLWNIEPSLDVQAPGNGKLLVGLCAEGSGAIANRSLPKSQAQKIISSVPEACFVNIHQKRIDLPGVLNASVAGIAPLASTISACDLVISVDTFQAHLAASLGKPTWILLSNPRNGIVFWHKDACWYPSMRQFRNREQAGLDDVVDQVIEALRNESCNRLVGQVADGRVLFGNSVEFPSPRKRIIRDSAATANRTQPLQ
jgi:hypothetical protein